MMKIAFHEIAGRRRSTGDRNPLRRTKALAVGIVMSMLAPAALADTGPDDAAHALVHLFDEAAIVGQPSTVDCTLSGGEKTRCLAITVTGSPADHATGPWCPRTISDDAAKGGIWLESGAVHDVDGAFIEGLASFYDDPTWHLYDEKTGRIRVTDTRESCQAAARPNVDPAYQNHCVECEPSYVNRSVERTYVLPLDPVRAKGPIRVNGEQGTGVALNGVRLDGPAPTDAILGAYTLAPFDDCGGHVNLHVGYHYHAVTGCSTEVEVAEDHTPVIGLAMDGYRIHARLEADGEEPDDLDPCRGHETPGLGYHYHANAPGSNAILPCHSAQTGCSNAGRETACDASTIRPRRGPPRPPRPRD